MVGVVELCPEETTLIAYQGVGFQLEVGVLQGSDKFIAIGTDGIFPDSVR